MGIAVTADDCRFLLAERWFAGKARAVDRLDVVAAAPLCDDAVLAVVRVEFADGADEVYFVPLVNTPDGLHDGLANEQACIALLNLVATGRTIPCEPAGAGRFVGVPSPLFAELQGSPQACLFVRPAAHDQSNSAVQFGERLFLKVFRKLEPGLNTDYEIARFLTVQQKFSQFPRVAGAIEFQASTGDSAIAATLLEWVPNEGDAWHAALAEVQLTLTSGKVRAMTGARLLGQRTAELHLALADANGNPAFDSEPMGPADCAALSRRLRVGAETVFRTLEQAKADLDSEVAGQVQTLLARGPGLVERFADSLATPPSCTKQRIHGDYHLGQVLCQSGDFVLLDFEGEPARPLAERRQKDSPLRDVAGMLRSFGYAAYSGLFNHREQNAAAPAASESLVCQWQELTASEYLNGYFAAALGASFVPVDSAVCKMLLNFFVFEKALYEVMYELNNRPAWLKIPLAGIQPLLGA
jgi:trehalose synthase-fused probable maltokinase